MKNVVMILRYFELNQKQIQSGGRVGQRIRVKYNLLFEGRIVGVRGK